MLVEQAAASFFGCNFGRLAVTDRRLVFRSDPTPVSGQFVFSIPLRGVAQCEGERRWRILGLSREVVVALRESPFRLRFQMREGKETLWQAVIAAVEKGRSSPDLPRPTVDRVLPSVRAKPKVRDAAAGGNPVYVRCEPSWGDPYLHAGLLR